MVKNKSNLNEGGNVQLEIYDTTLRDGSQAPNIYFGNAEKLRLARELDLLGVDYIEYGWPTSKEQVGEFRQAVELFGKKISAFGSTSRKRNPADDFLMNYLLETGARVTCIFGKTWKPHVELQLRITPEENLERISKSVEFLSQGSTVFYDAEHYFDGFESDKEYALNTLVAASGSGASRLVLCDTRGGMLPKRVEEIVGETEKYLAQRGIENKLGVHFHNDGGLALANALVSVPKIVQVQGTLNGMGERVGNMSLTEFLGNYVSKMNGETNVDLKKLKQANELVCRLAKQPLSASEPFVGDLAFAHKGGVHIDAIQKGASYEHADPEDFGNSRICLLNTQGGVSGVIGAAKQFGLELEKKDSAIKQKAELLFEELREMEKRGYKIEHLPAEHFLLIKKYFGNLDDILEIEDWDTRTGKRNGREISAFDASIKLGGEIVVGGTVLEGGPVDAAYKTIQGVVGRKYRGAGDLELVDFSQNIALNHGEESAVRTCVEFSNSERFKTVGISENLIESSLEAIVKAFRCHLNKF